MSNYRHAVLHTKGKTDEEIRREYGTFKPTPEEEELARSIYDAWDGLRCLVSESIEPGFYTYIAPFTPEDERQAIEALYLMEQDRVFGTYIDMREEFDRDYANGNYSPAGSIEFSKDDVEIIDGNPEDKR